MIPSQDFHTASFVFGYLDPGSGFVYSSAVATIVKLISAPVAFLVLATWRFLRRRRWLFLALGAAVMTIIMLVMYWMKNASYSQTSKQSRRVVILAIDGLDPEILAQGMDRGMLPVMQNLKDTGFLRTLATVTPPQSPVVWASFITGSSPAKHGIYDFIRRTPGSYSLDLSLSQTDRQLLRASSLIQTLSDAGIPVHSLFLPDTYPPPKLNHGTVLSGMGVPDILGTEGKFTVFSTANLENQPRLEGRFINITNTDPLSGSLPGPVYDFFGEQKTAEIRWTAKLTNEGADISIQNKKISLKEGVFSPWVPVSFWIDFLTEIHGIVRLFLKSADPFVLYVSPIAINPQKPTRPVSYPSGLSQNLANEFGQYSTLGLPIDTWAYEYGIFDKIQFLSHVDDIVKERKNIVFHQLKQFETGVFIAYFGITDTVAHMFWRDQQETILAYYKKMDAVIGDMQELLRDDDILIIVSDHGFGPFEHEMNLNAWLRDNGYLALNAGRNTGRELFVDIDWSKTSAYAAGYNGLFLNRKNRERSGIVTEKQSDALLDEISKKLLSFTNSYTDKPVIKQVYDRKSLHIPDSDTDARTCLSATTEAYGCHGLTPSAGYHKTPSQQKAEHGTGIIYSMRRRYPESFL